MARDPTQPTFEWGGFAAAPEVWRGGLMKKEKIQAGRVVRGRGRERPGEVKRKREKAVREKTCRAGTVSI
jgi:hypothetical protein